MEIEDVAGVCLAAWWATKKKRHLTVGLGLLGEIVVHDEAVFAVVHPVLTNCTTSERCEVLERCRVGGRSHHDDGVVHGAVFGERAHGLRNG